MREMIERTGGLHRRRGQKITDEVSKAGSQIQMNLGPIPGRRRTFLHVMLNFQSPST